MAKITLGGNPVDTLGELPEIGSQAKPFTLVKSDLSEVALSEFKGKKVILNIFPSLETSVCSASIRRFNEEANNLDNTVVLCISADLPFAHKRFCEAEGLDNVIPLSVFRNPEFGQDYQVTMLNGKFAGLLSRSVVILNREGEVIYTEQVPEIGQEPDYQAALEAVNK